MHFIITALYSQTEARSDNKKEMRERHYAMCIYYIWKLLEHCKMEPFRQGREKKSDRYKDAVWSKQMADRNQAKPHMLPIWWNTMYSHFTPCPVQENDCQSHFSLALSLFLLRMNGETERLFIWMTASIGKAPSLICLLWPMLDLRGLISLDNKTKRVNVLIVADGAGILGKCVKLVLTSGPHSSPPCCDLLLPSLRCSLHPSHSIPHSSHVHRSIPPVTLSLISLCSNTSV